MNSVNKYFSITILLFILNTNNLAQDHFENQFNLGKKLFDEEKYFDAVTEFKRLLFFDTEIEYSYEANRYLGFSYKNGGLFSDALHYFTLAELNAKTTDEIFNCRIEIVKVNILRRTTDAAFRQLEMLEQDPNYESKKTEINYWKGWAYIFADDWENAARIFATLEEQDELKLLSEKTFDELYSVSLAKALSYLIPGAGQIYTGEYVNGLISLGWNLLWGYLTIDAFIEDRIFDGVVVGSLLWMRFYLGGVENAEKFARQKNLEITNETLRYLQTEYKGPKP
ncbi:MAG TPA: hypothetical protein VH917_06860 [Ignavibacteriaceae bacterium]|jgi:hypothetical protein